MAGGGGARLGRGGLQTGPGDGVRERVDVEADERAKLGMRADDGGRVTARAHRAVHVASQGPAIEGVEDLAHQHGHVRGVAVVLARAGLVRRRRGRRAGAKPPGTSEASRGGGG